MERRLWVKLGTHMTWCNVRSDLNWTSPTCVTLMVLPLGRCSKVEHYIGLMSISKCAVIWSAAPESMIHWLSTEDVFEAKNVPATCKVLAEDQEVVSGAVVFMLVEAEQDSWTDYLISYGK